MNLKRYDELSKEKKRALRKEYYNGKPSRMILRLLGMASLLMTLIFGGFAVYYISESMPFVFSGKSFMWPFIMMSCLTISFPFTLKSIEDFWYWLWRDKNILSRDWPKKKMDSTSENLRIYATLPKEEKRELRKKYFNSVKSAKVFLALGLISSMIGLLHFGTLIYDFIWMPSNGYSEWVGISGLYASGIAAYIFIRQAVFAKYFIWLEYEENIVRKPQKA